MNLAILISGAVLIVFGERILDRLLWKSKKNPQKKERWISNSIRAVIFLALAYFVPGNFFMNLAVLVAVFFALYDFYRLQV